MLLSASGAIRTARLFIVLVFIFACRAATVAAEPLVVSSGYLDVRQSTGRMLVGGSSGFTLDAQVSTADGVFGPSSCNATPTGCLPGNTIDLTALWVGGDLRATASLRGHVYNSVGSATSTSQAAVRFSGAASVPAAGTAQVTISAPFAFEGTFHHLDPLGAPVQDTLSGAGTAYLTLSPTQFLPGGWNVSRVTYAFDSALPFPWVAADIGNVAVSGDAHASGGFLTVSGAGADIWGSADEFMFAFQSLAGDGVVQTRVDAETAVSPFAKAGIMMRGGVDAGAAHVILDAKPNGELEFMTRGSLDGATEWRAGAFAAFPVWLKLERSGNLITGSYRTETGNWSVIGSIVAPVMKFAGLVVTSHQPDSLNTGTFSGADVAVSTETLPSGWSHADVGDVGIAGDARFAAATGFSIRGAGGDIWGDTDGFHFAFQPVQGDASITARVVSFDATNTFAKAGVMLRTSSAANSAHVILDMRPSGEVEFMTRTADGAATTYLSGSFIPANGYLRLQRVGGAIAGYVSTDGLDWVFVGSALADLGDQAFAGLIVTSHDTSRSATGVFDAVTLLP
jgi:hypothetical protein